MAYIDTYILSNDAALQQRITVSIVTAIRTVVTESAATPNHASRLAWAGRAIQDPTAMMQQMKWGVLTNATILTNGSASTDAQIQTALDSIIDAFADLAL